MDDPPRRATVGPSAFAWPDIATAVPKTCLAGTHRTLTPAQTLARMRPVMAMMGITRIANVTGLDRIGVPVAVACRPNARSLSVSQGKGIDLDASKASALMESIEAWHAERLDHPLKLGSLEDLRYTHRLADVDGLPRLENSTFHPLASLLWIEGADLLAGVTRWVPYELVHTNYTLPLPSGSGCFAATSNGLASGNHLLEAISHAICEVVERDAIALWQLRARGGLDDGDGQSSARLDLASVDDPDCRAVLEKFRIADVAVSVWDITSDIGIATFACLISESDDPFHPLYSALGMGCHPAREIALLRALTEAAQSRLTVISGSRDDVARGDYERTRSPDVLRRDRALHGTVAIQRTLRDVPTFHGETINDDVIWELDRLRAAGVEQAVVVDLTRQDLRIPVVRAVVPGLEGVKQMAGYVPGPRGRRVLARISDRTSVRAQPA